MTLIAHMERYLGPIAAGWSERPGGERMHFQIARYDSVTDGDAVAFSTLGLSRYALGSPVSAKIIRHELLMLVPASMNDDAPVPGLLERAGTDAIHSGKAYVRGDVIQGMKKMFGGAAMEALYVTAPAYFPDEFATCGDESGPIVIAWLVPITAREAEFVGERGWDAFEDALADRNADLIDISRPPVV